MITAQVTAELTAKFGTTPKDTGRSEVQVAILTYRINYLSGHFENHKLDYHSRRGLMQLIGKRRRLLRYLEETDHSRYNKLIQELGLRK